MLTASSLLLLYLLPVVTMWSAFLLWGVVTPVIMSWHKARS